MSNPPASDTTNSTTPPVRHVPPWPLFAAIGVLVLVVISGIVASNISRSDNANDPCSALALLGAVRNSGQLDREAAEDLQEPRTYRCRDNYGYALIGSQSNDRAGGMGWFKYENNRWVLLSFGPEPVADPVARFGITADLASYLTGTPISPDGTMGPGSTAPPGTRSADSTRADSNSADSTATTALPTAKPVDVGGCTVADLTAAINASDSVADDIKKGGVRFPKYRCIDNYGYASIQPVQPDQQGAFAYFMKEGGQWKVLSLGGDIGDGSDVGVPRDLSMKLRS